MRTSIAAGLAAVLLSSPAGAAPIYQPPSELLFVPLPTPCRAFKVKVNARTTKQLHIGGTANFPDQGGTAGGCGVPDSATAVSISLSVFGASAPGHATAWRDGASRPNIVTTSFPRHDQVTTGATVALGSGMINIYPTQRARFVGDVTGFYVRPLAGFISSSGSPYSGSPRILSSSRIAIGTYEVVFDRDIRYCAATATAYNSNYYASTTTWYDSTRPNTVRVFVWNSAAAAADQYFYISVRC